MIRLRLLVFGPLVLLYGGAVLAGASGTATGAVWVFAALFLAYMALAGHQVFRNFDARRAASWIGLAALTAVQVVLASVVFFGAGAIARVLGAPPPGAGPLWPVLVTAAALPLTRPARRLTDPAFAAFLDEAGANLGAMAADIERQVARDAEEWARLDAERAAEDRAVLGYEIARLDRDISGMDAEDLAWVASKLAGLSVEPEVLDALSARVARPEWRRLRQDYLRHPDVFGKDFDFDALRGLVEEELAMPLFRDGAALVALRFDGDFIWSRADAARLLEAARSGPRSDPVDTLIAALEQTDGR